MSYVTEIEKRTLENEHFREVLFTGKHSQLVLMSIAPGEEIGMETHDGIDQFIRIEGGRGKAVLDGVDHPLEDGTAVVISAGTRHNIINLSGTVALKLYTLYSPPEHPDGTVHKDKAEADEYERTHHG